MVRCPQGCRGIELGDGNWSGCVCSGDGCDCPHHGHAYDCGHDAEIARLENEITTARDHLASADDREEVA